MDFLNTILAQRINGGKFTLAARQLYADLSKRKSAAAILTEQAMLSPGEAALAAGSIRRGIRTMGWDFFNAYDLTDLFKRSRSILEDLPPKERLRVCLKTYIYALKNLDRNDEAQPLINDLQLCETADTSDEVYYMIVNSTRKSLGQAVDWVIGLMLCQTLCCIYSLEDLLNDEFGAKFDDMFIVNERWAEALALQFYIECTQMRDNQPELASLLKSPDIIGAMAMAILCRSRMFRCLPYGTLEIYAAEQQIQHDKQAKRSLLTVIIGIAAMFTGMHSVTSAAAGSLYGTKKPDVNFAKMIEEKLTEDTIQWVIAGVAAYRKRMDEGGSIGL